ncbi:hypothetical protein KUCAC02_016656, partial [Chaenocephalus aceratus]
LSATKPKQSVSSVTDDIDALLEELLEEDYSDSPPRKAEAAPKGPEVKKRSSQSGGRKCCPVFVGGSAVANGVGTATSKRSCDQLRCTSCDFKVLMFDDCEWDSSCDYLFFSAAGPLRRRLQISGIVLGSDGSAANTTAEEPEHRLRSSADLRLSVSTTHTLRDICTTHTLRQRHLHNTHPQRHLHNTHPQRETSAQHTPSDRDICTTTHPQRHLHNTHPQRETSAQHTPSETSAQHTPSETSAQHTPSHRDICTTHTLRDICTTHTLRERHLHNTHPQTETSAQHTPSETSAQHTPSDRDICTTHTLRDICTTHTLRERHLHNTHPQTETSAQHTPSETSAQHTPSETSAQHTPSDRDICTTHTLRDICTTHTLRDICTSRNTFGKLQPQYQNQNEMKASTYGPTAVTSNGTCSWTALVEAADEASQRRRSQPEEEEPARGGGANQRRRSQPEEEEPTRGGGASQRRRSQPEEEEPARGGGASQRRRSQPEEEPARGGGASQRRSQPEEEEPARGGGACQRRRSQPEEEEYKDLHVYQLEHPTQVIEWTSGKTVCVAGYSSSKNEILELQLPLKLFAEENKGLCAERDFKVVHGGSRRVLFAASDTCVVTNDGLTSDLQVWTVGGDDSDVIRRTGSVAGRKKKSDSEGGSRIAARHSSQVLHGAQSDDIQLTQLTSGQILYTPGQVLYTPGNTDLRTDPTHQVTLTSGQILTHQVTLTSGQILYTPGNTDLRTDPLHQVTLTSGQILTHQDSSGQILYTPGKLTSGQILTHQVTLTSGQILTHQVTLTSGQILTHQDRSSTHQVTLTSGQVLYTPGRLTSGQVLYTPEITSSDPLSSLQFVSDDVFLAGCCNGNSVPWWTDAAAGASSGSFIRVSSSGRAEISDLRNPGAAVSRAQLSVQSRRCNPGHVTVSWAPALNDCIAVSGFSGLVQIYNTSGWGAELQEVQPLFEHRGHAVSSQSDEGDVFVTSQLWHPERPRTLLSAASDGSVHVWDWVDQSDADR